MPLSRKIGKHWEFSYVAITRNHKEVKWIIICGEAENGVVDLAFIPTLSMSHTHEGKTLRYAGGRFANPCFHNDPIDVQAFSLFWTIP